MTRHNAYFLEDLSIGMSESVEKIVEDADIQAFTAVSDDLNPVHHDDEYAAKTVFKKRVAHGMLTASLFSNVLGTRLPGNGAIYLSQTLKFKGPVFIGDKVVASANITAIDTKRGRVTLDCVCKVEGKIVVEGEACVLVASRAGNG